MALALEVLAACRHLVAGAYVMPQFDRYDLAAQLVRQIRQTSVSDTAFPWPARSIPLKLGHGKMRETGRYVGTANSTVSSPSSTSTRSRFLEEISRKALIFDGAMGTSIQSLNLTDDDFGGKEGCNEYLVLTAPDIIRECPSAVFLTRALMSWRPTRSAVAG